MSTDINNRAEALRKRASARGLRLVRRGTVYTLYQDETMLHRGAVDDVAAYLRTHHPGRPSGGKPKPECAVPPAWAHIIDDYMLSLAAASLTLRPIQLVRMARDLGGSPADVTADMLVAWFGAQTGWKTETRRSYRAAVRGFWRWAYRTKRVPEHLADELPKVREHHGATRPAPDHAWQSALASADARTTLMLRLAGEAGMRRGEVSRVHSRDLLEGSSGAQLLVHGKGNKERVVPISDSLAEALRPHGTAGGGLFPNGQGGHLSPWMVGRLVAQVLPDHWTIHTLRHRFSSRAYRGTRNLRAVQVLLGHESIATTERYCAVDDDEIRATMEAAGATI